MYTAGLGLSTSTAYRSRLWKAWCLPPVDLALHPNHDMDSELVFNGRMVCAPHHHRHCSCADRESARDICLGSDVRT
jgi:hypothetical protein